MPEQLDDTRPGVVVNPNYRNTRNEVPAPPRLLLFGVIGIFVLGIVGVIGSVLIFRDVLEPGQQQRVINLLPFMDQFLPPHPGAGDTLPTLEPNATENISAQDLLNMSFGTMVTATVEAAGVEATVETATPEPTEVAATETLTVEPTEVSQLQPTLEPTLEPTTAVASAPSQQTQTVSQSSVMINPISVPHLPTALLTGITYVKQTWNNCGPANTTMALSFYGWQNDQVFAASFLKPGGREDKNVNPGEIVAFVNSQTQLKALTRIGGNPDVIKALISNNIPVIIETGYYTEGSDWLGHYQTLVGYDDNLGQFYVNDSNIGENHIEDYDYLNTKWQHFNYRFIAIYRPQDEALVAGILGDLADPDKAAELAFETAQSQAKLDSSDEFAWFNMGSSLVATGDYERASAAFDKALALGKLPWRMLWYQFGPFEAYYHTGRYADVVTYADANISNTGEYVEEIHYWLGMALEAEGKNTEAASAFRRALLHNPQYEAAQVALTDLNNKS